MVYLTHEYIYVRVSINTSHTEWDKTTPRRDPPKVGRPARQVSPCPDVQRLLIVSWLLQGLPCRLLPWDGSVPL